MNASGSFSYLLFLLPFSVILTIVVVFGLLSWLSGWGQLVERFRETAEPKDGQTYRFASGFMRISFIPVRFKAALSITLTDQGIHLSTFFLFRLFLPALFIPWAQIESVEKKELMFGPVTIIRVRDYSTVIGLRGQVGQILKTVYDARR